MLVHTKKNQDKTIMIGNSVVVGLNKKPSKVFCLFLTDIYESKDGALLYGIFTDKATAERAARDNNLYMKYDKVIIKEVVLDKFVEDAI